VDLIMLILVIAIVGFVVYILTTKIPMPPYWATILQVLAALVLLVYLLRVLGAGIPNVLP
jgi:hypothetical protein